MGATALSSSANSGHHGQRAAHGLHQRAAKRIESRVGRAVHADAVVPQKDGTFANVVYDRGTVKSISGQDLTITEGTKTVVYKDVTITIPSDAKVRRAGTGKATLADLQAGDRVAVVQAPKNTFVLAAPARSTSTR
ncbi:MAG: hypothetical protein JWM71_1694 [Solirubrobacteraceae bacterium]|nr:hypothetical protein [Solirubrobacteraceae bacterium]